MEKAGGMSADNTLSAKHKLFDKMCSLAGHSAETNDYASSYLPLQLMKSPQSW